METWDRILPLTGAFNFRDLGGYPTVDGRVTRRGLLFRSDTLHELTKSDVEVLRGIGLATIIDLRGPAELKRTGRGLLESEPMGYRHLPLVVQGGLNQGAPLVAREDLAQRYLWYLEVGQRTMVEALTTVGDPTSHPLVFHCAAGKDRTGVLAAIVLGLLGVEPSLIVDDYVLTASRMDPIIARIRRQPDAEIRIAEIPQFLLEAKAATMERFLDLLQEHHGGARQWAKDVGVPADTLSRIPSMLLES